jgi:hypothetical protein
MGLTVAGVFGPEIAQGASVRTPLSPRLELANSAADQVRLSFKFQFQDDHPSLPR